MAGNHPRRNDEHHKFDRRERRPINCVRGNGRLRHLEPLSHRVVTDAIDLGLVGTDPVIGLGGGYYDREQVERGLGLRHLRPDPEDGNERDSDYFLN
jgi:hypothetical protein